MDKMVDAMRGIVLAMEEILEFAKIKEATLRKAFFFKNPIVFALVNTVMEINPQRVNLFTITVIVFCGNRQRRNISFFSPHNSQRIDAPTDTTNFAKTTVHHSTSDTQQHQAPRDRQQQHHATPNTQNPHTNNNPIWRGSVLTGEELPPHTGELNDVHYVAQPNPSYPALCRQDTTLPKRHAGCIMV